MQNIAEESRRRQVMIRVKHPSITINHGALRMLAASLFVLPALALPAHAAEPEPKVEVVTKGLVHPWGLAFLPDGRMLVSEREGRLRLVSPSNGALSPPITGVPAVMARGQGGLLGLALDPDFANNRQVYLCFSEARGGGSGTSVFRGALNASGKWPRDLPANPGWQHHAAFWL
jgi:aldose sugar dehydrogenase